MLRAKLEACAPSRARSLTSELNTPKRLCKECLNLFPLAIRRLPDLFVHGSTSYGFARQGNKASPSQNDPGEPPRGFARTELKSSGQRTLSRFRNGARGACSNFISHGARRLHRSVLSGSRSCSRARHDDTAARPRIFRQAQHWKRRPANAVALQRCGFAYLECADANRFAASSGMRDCVGHPARWKEKCCRHDSR